MSQILEERLKRWKEKLIDLSKRNRLLNFRQTKVTTVKIVDEIPSEIYKLVYLDGQTMEFLAKPEDEDEGQLKVQGEENNTPKEISPTQEFQKYEGEELEDKHIDKYLQTNLTKEQLQKNLFRIYSNASSVMEEQGYNVLFLALGCLEWYESQNSEVKLKSPIILIPIELTRKSVKSLFKLKSTEEPPILNPALILKLQNDFGIKINSAIDLEDSDPQEIFLMVQKAIEQNKRFRVTNDIYLSLFSFAKFVMYKDLEIYSEAILNNPIIQVISGEVVKGSDSLGLFCDLEEIEKNIHPLKTFQVLDADSSQQQAILAVKNGCNLLIEGPPGTGKSQTIANIIAECLTQGKKVLFVSQKMAALEVVKKRLENTGLGDFCLELHSRKINKSEVIKELVRVFESQKKPDHGHDEDLHKLEQLKAELSSYVKELHNPYGKLEMTPYQAFGIIHSNPDIKDIGYIFQDVEEWSKNKFNICCDLLDSLAHHLMTIKNPDQHVWNGSELTDINYQEKLKLMEVMDNIIDMYPKLQEQANALAEVASFIKPTSLNDIEVLLDATLLIINSPKPPKSILEDSRWNTLGSEIVYSLDTVKQFNEFKDAIRTRYDISFIDTEIKKLLDRYQGYTRSFLFFLNPSYWKDRKIVRQYTLDDTYKPNRSEATEDLKKIFHGKQIAEKLNNMSVMGKELFGDLWRGRDTNWKSINDFSQWIVRFRSHVVKEYFKNSIFDELSKDRLKDGKLDSMSSNLKKEIDQFKNYLTSFVEGAKINELNAFGGELNQKSLDDIFKKISTMRQTIDDVDLWIKYQSLLKSCFDVGIKDFATKVLSLNLSFQKTVNTFKCQFLKCWLAAVFSNRLALKRFYGEDHERLIQKFSDLDKRQINLARIRIQHLLSGKMNSDWQASKESELGILLRESRKKRAVMPLRKLFQKTPHVITALKPCLMMSPLTVAQFLDPNLLEIDMIIFDEASQIPPEDSIGCIMRGKQVVIAGDSNQLPPTSFFQTEVITPEDEKNFDEMLPADLGSILDECAVTSFPKVMLRWHYRSRHESLIAFSNKNFYENRLNTFPSADDNSKHLGLKFNYLSNTMYDRGGSGTNVKEANEVAKAVFNHFKESPELSLGVGTFSIRQKYAIEDAIENMLKEDNSLETFFFKDKKEPFFVKNLEIIQGDERDVIFLSIGYGKDNSGKLPMNFGPINQQGGHRRLNVLVTRARNRLELFSSIRGDDFDLSKTNSLGVQLLKKYLDFAEKGYIVLEQDSDATSDGVSESPFENAVYNALSSKNINVTKQLGCSGYRIDLAVADDEQPGRYILGIECDGASYHSCYTARDRDRLRQQVLEDLGWNIYRIWSTDWFNNHKRELDKLLKAISRAKQGEYVKKKVNPTTEPQVNYRPVQEKPHHNSHQISIKPYSKTSIGSQYPTETFYSLSLQRVSNVLKKIVECESPIHKDEAARRVINCWGMKSVKSKIRDQLTRVEGFCEANNMITVKGKFYWSPNMQKPIVRSRDSEDIVKNIEYVAPEEIGEASLIVLKNEYSIPKNELINQTAKLLGFNRTTKNIDQYIWKSIQIYLNAGKILEKNGRLILNNNEEEDVGDATIINTSSKEKIARVEKLIRKDEKLVVFDRLINNAITNDEEITIEYQTAALKITTRKIKPIKYDGAYIQAYCHLVNDNRTFRLDRIKKIQEED